MELALLILLGFVAGTLGSLLGLGGGFLVVPVLILLRGMDPRLATGTAVAVIVPTMAVTLWRRGMQGHIDWRLGLLIAIGAVGGAFLGSWIAGQVSSSVIRKVFAFVLLGLAALLLFTDGKPTPAEDGASEEASAVGYD